MTALCLELIDSGGKSGVTVTRLRPIYEEATRRFPEIYEGYGFLGPLGLSAGLADDSRLRSS
jgi:hypothetical protein